MLDFNQYINSLELAQLQACQKLIAETILSKTINTTASVYKSKLLDPEPSDINDYIDYETDFLSDSSERQILLSELESEHLGFSKSKRNKKVQNKFISMVNKPYSWNSHNGSVTNDPMSFEDFPAISRILNNINSKNGYRLNCVLVSYYASGECNTRLHDDAEKCIDSNQPICILSIGAKRRIEWVDKLQESYRDPVQFLDPADSSLYTMKAGCQERFLHRVRKNKRVREGRYCLSFRCFVEDWDNVEPSNTGLLSRNLCGISHIQSTPVPEHSNTEVLDQPQESEMTKESTTPDPVKKAMLFSNISNPSNVRNGYSPFPNQDQMTLSNLGHSSVSRPNKKLCVLFGTSITTRVDPKILSRKDTTIVNRSVSGARIRDIHDSMYDFYYENINHTHSVSKVLFSLGTNEIKNFNSFKFSTSKFYEPVVNLVKQTKLLFPLAEIIFQCLLPIRATYRYSANSVHEFNELLIKICRKYDCIFLDCFGLFLDGNGFDINEDLYWDNYHLNDKRGIRLLCQVLKDTIYGNTFNPFARIDIQPYYTC